MCELRHGHEKQTRNGFILEKGFVAFGFISGFYHQLFEVTQHFSLLHKDIYMPFLFTRFHTHVDWFHWIYDRLHGRHRTAKSGATIFQVKLSSSLALSGSGPHETHSRLEWSTSYSKQADLTSSLQGPVKKPWSLHWFWWLRHRKSLPWGGFTSLSPSALSLSRTLSRSLSARRRKIPGVGAQCLALTFLAKHAGSKSLFDLMLLSAK